MSVYTADDLQFKVNNKNAWTVMCRAAPSKKENIIIPEIVANRYTTTIAHESFINDTFLKMVKIPKSITKIGHKAFMGCERLDAVIIPNTFEELTIRYQAFQDCKTMPGIEIMRPTIIENMAFAGCTNMKIVRGMIDKVEEGAFDGCKSLEQVHFHTAVSLEDGIFDGCNNLKEITFADHVYCTDDFIKHVLSKVKVKCKKHSNLVQLAYEGYCIEVF